MKGFDRMLLEYLKILGIDNMPEEIIKYLDAPSMVRLKNIGYFCGMDYASKEVYDFKELIYEINEKFELISDDEGFDKVYYID